MMLRTEASTGSNLGNWFSMSRAAAETEPYNSTSTPILHREFNRGGIGRGTFKKKPNHARQPQQMGSAFTDWRNSVESALTGGTSDALPPLSITLPGGTAPVAKPAAKPTTTTILGMPITTVGIIGFAGLLAMHFLKK